jgi:hypothetical protein
MGSLINDVTVLEVRVVEDFVTIARELNTEEHYDGGEDSKMVRNCYVMLFLDNPYVNFRCYIKFFVLSFEMKDLVRVFKTVK